MKRRLLLLIATLAAGAALASDEIPPPPQREPLVIVNAVLHPVSGPLIDGGRMLVEGGRIRAIAKPGEPLALPPGTRTLDLAGRHVYPGFIAANSALGLTEVGSVPATNDGNETGAINPNARAVVAVNPDSELIPVARSNGILAALAAPGGRGSGAIAGTAAVIQLDGWTWEQMALEREAALMVELPSMRWNPALFGPPLDALLPEVRKAAEQRLREIDEAFDAARAWGRARAADPRTPGDLRWQAMQPVLAGQRPVFVVANELAQIRWALSLAERQGLKLVIVGGADAGRIADVLAARQVPVVIGGVHRLPLRRDDDVDAPFRLAAELARAGVPFCIAREGGSFAAANERNLPYEAATAAAFGLPRDEALKAITLYPARILGVADRLGSLEPGKLASFIVTDGDPLETPTRIERIFVQGREVDAGNRQQRLVRKYEEKYRQLGGPR